MKKNKLTPAQVQNLAMVLASQFQGKKIAIGEKYCYNENLVYAGSLKYIPENKSMAFLNESRIGNRICGISLKNSGCLDFTHYGYNKYWSFPSVNVSKVLSFDNGKTVINTALTLMGTH